MDNNYVYHLVRMNDVAVKLHAVIQVQIKLKEMILSRTSVVKKVIVVEADNN